MVQNLDNAEFVNAVEANRIEVAKIVLGLYHFLHEEGLVLVAPPPPVYHTTRYCRDKSL